MAYEIAVDKGFASLPTKKYCRGCKTAKEFSEYYKNQSQCKKFGIMSRCKVCSLKEKKNWKAKKREREEEQKRLTARLNTIDRMVEFDLIPEEEGEVAKSSELEIFHLGKIDE